MHLHPIQTGPGCVCQCLVTGELTCWGFLQSMRMLLSFGVRRHMVHAAPEPSYEAMLALDENNPRRGVKKHILEQLPHVRIPHCPSASLQMPCRHVLTWYRAPNCEAEEHRHVRGCPNSSLPCALCRIADCALG